LCSGEVPEHQRARQMLLRICFDEIMAEFTKNHLNNQE
jgi:uncharacterized protein (UPF0297 family)